MPAISASFVGFEKERNTLKYRCPAAAFGFGRIVRIPIDTDRRIFTPIARHIGKWKKAYDRRTSVERVNSRLDQVLGFEHHTIRGKRR